VTIINSTSQLRGTAYHAGTSRPSRSGREGKMGGVLLLSADFTFVCPNRTRRPADKYEELQKLGVEVYSVQHRHALRPQRPGTTRLRPSRRTSTPCSPILRAPSALLRGLHRGGRASVPRNLCGRHPRQDKLVESRTTRSVATPTAAPRIQAAQFVASHDGEVCPAKWNPGAPTLKPASISWANLNGSRRAPPPGHRGGCPPRRPPRRERSSC
jgi:peroxiredoxin (alkyl hydroperoxide reductase subunit C)